MADDKMKNDQRNMGAGEKDKNFGQQSPGRGGQGGQQAGQHGGGQQSGQQGGGQFGGQKGTQNIDDDDEFGGGKTGQGGSQNRGGQNR